MKIVLLQIDKTDQAFVEEGIKEFSKRIIRYNPFEIITISINKTIRNKTIPEQKLEEERQILAHLEKYDTVYLLDENGKEYSSLEFSRQLQTILNSGNKNLCFVIGGPYGFTDTMRKKYSLISFSRFTFSHQMIRILFCEQLYRAFSIIKGEKYHHQ
ncbi:MAG TPA: 23S rRNA (pseudouridine(1915)-N(3))-methyltransferase RlmH [Bacteroidia bacterium]|jgi:23S rRNA (pseudouridine1915-N3)-methyltransferase|nr:23S rRNA (pseudouridine(1915)-N(3))-methyltransferase RlmH [Bacteroidia bacterium]